MGKKEKRKAKFVFDEEEEEKATSSVLVPSSSDDEAGNEDLTLKIVEKAMSRASKTTRVLNESNRSRGVGSVGVIDLSSSQDEEILGDAECLTDLKNKKKSKKEKKRKKKKRIDIEEEIVDVLSEEEKAKAVVNTFDMLAGMESNPVEPCVDTPDNIVLRKLLRGPRYFDPPDSGWGACYNCGEEGHTTVNCTSARRKKPCFYCGSLEHNFKQCTKGRDCFICKSAGHRAKDCPDKYKVSRQSSKFCLRCGDYGHEMFSCRNDYSSNDLQHLQCYICKSYGHLCCFSFADTGPREVSCYKCGRLGHTGLACTGSREETYDVMSPSSCYKCGEEGHFSWECPSTTKVPSTCYKCGEEGHFLRECTSTTKVEKRNRELSTPGHKHPKEKHYTGFKSAPHDLGKIRKRKKSKYEEREITTPYKSRQRGGWITEDPEDFPLEKPRKKSWKSPATPTNWSHYSTSQSSKRSWNAHYGSTPQKQGLSNSFQHRYSASRFGNNTNSRNDDWYDRPNNRNNYDWY